MSESGAPSRPFEGLDPDLILDAVDGFGCRSDGRLIALNSYENRVYQVGQEEGPPIVAKFYRPQRWSTAAILEEHAFAAELAEREVPVIAPLADAEGATLREHGGFRVAIYPRRSGGWPDLNSPERRQTMGRFVARIHAVGALRPFHERPELEVDTFGWQPRARVLASELLSPGIESRYADESAALVEAAGAAFAELATVARIRTHGDCHGGNVLWGDEGPAFVDLDDARTAPPVQDLWMLLSGTREEREAQLADVLDGYRTFCHFNLRELALIEALRALRMVHYAGWLARRWDDPAFPAAFPFFGTPAYWEDHIASLADQRRKLDEPPLRAF